MKFFVSVLMCMTAVCSHGQSLVIDGGNSPFRLSSSQVLSVTGGSYMTSNGVIEFGVAPDISGTPVSGLLSSDTVTLEQGAGIHLVSEVGAMDLDEIYTSKLIESDMLVFLLPNAVTNWSGPVYDSRFDLKNYIQLVQSNYLMQMSFYVEDTDLYVSYGRISLANSAGLEKGSDLWAVAEIVDQRGDGTDPLATTQINILNTMDGTKQQSQLRRLYETELPHHSHQKIMLTGVDITGSRSVSFRSARRFERDREEPVPAGTFGLHIKSQPIRPWSKLYGSHGSRIDDEFYDSYSHNVGGGVIGVDKGLGNLLFGAAGGYGMSHISSSLSDKSYADMVYGVLYASLATERWFANVSLSHGAGSVETDSGTVFDTTGDFGMDASAVYFGLGREIQVTEESAVFTPEIGVRSSLYRQNAYTESSTTALPRTISGYEHWSVRPTLGITASWPYEDVNFRCEPRVRAFWTRELNNKADPVDYSLVGDSEIHSLYIRGSESGFFTFGAGAAFIKDNGWEFAADLNSHFGELSTLEISLKAGYMF